MNILVNTRLLLSGKLEGIGWFTYENLKQITNKHPEHRFYFLFDRSYSKEFIFSENVVPIVAGPPTRHPVLWWFWFEWVVPRIIHKHKIDLFLSPDGYLSLSANVKTLLVIHDINFIHRPQDLPFLTGKYYNYFTPKFARKATRIATVSEYSKQDIATSYAVSPNKIDVVYNGANIIYQPLTADEQQGIRQEYTAGDPYFIFVGALHPRKNVARLLQAFDQFKEEFQSPFKLVIVGEKMFKSEDIHNSYQSMKHSDEVVFSGRLTPEILRNLLASAVALTFVPYFEGFGIPIVEAFYCDTPVITSNLTSMPEVAADAALLVDPLSVDDIKNAMLKMASDEELRENLIEKGRIRRQDFSWDKTSEKLWGSMMKVAEDDF
ncbi:MAG: glycosyltransferase family 4 protein [Bacteroidales bacterium]|nr:glycosyltransferase family 4 protein [Bacteroidales bacterium]MCF8458541.1 glycosyltransferase family 4 protein [Bacteroidales bacterium]